jgi:clan AA aspartic protease
MGIVYITGTVAGPKEVKARVRFLVDSGATYTVLPMSVWKKLGLKPKWEEAFELADGSQVKRSISECRITLYDKEGHTPVILGESEDKPLLGVITLEEFGLVLNPFTRKLQPMRLMLS